jgi:hypothetical protein
VLSTVIAFLLFQARDNALPVSARAAISITAIGGGTTDEQVVKSIERAARELRLSVSKVVPDLERPEHLRSLYVFDGREPFQRERLEEIYGAFSAAMETRIFEGQQLLGHDLRGLYSVDVGPEEAAPLVDSLVKLGVAAEIEAVDASRILGDAASDLALLPVILAFTICLLIVIGYAASSSRKGYVIRQIHGAGELRLFAVEWASILFFSSVVGAAIVGVLAIASSILRGPTGFADVLGWVLLGMGGVVGLTLAFHLLAFLFTPNVDPIQILNGRRPLAYVALVSMVSYLACFVIVVAGTANIAVLIERATTAADASSRWVVAKDLAAVRMSHSLVTEDQQALERRFGAFYSKAQSEVGAVLAYGGVGQGLDASDPKVRFAPYSGNSLIVNPRFLARELVTDSNGDRISETSTEGTVVTLLIPKSNAADAGAIEEEYREFAAFERSLRQGEAESGSPPLAVKLINDDQRIFTFSDGAISDSMLESPVIVVVPHEARVLSESFYLAATSTQNVLFEHALAVDALVKSEGIDDLVSSSYSVADRAGVLRSDLTQQVISHVIGMMLCSVALLASGLTIVTTYAHAASRRYAVRVMNGWGALRANKEFHFVHSALIVSALVVMRMSNALAPNQQEIALVASLGVVAVAFAALRTCQRHAVTSLANR